MRALVSPDFHFLLLKILVICNINNDNSLDTNSFKEFSNELNDLLNH